MPQTEIVAASKPSSNVKCEDSTPILFPWKWTNLESLDTAALYFINRSCLNLESLDTTLVLSPNPNSPLVFRTPYSFVIWMGRLAERLQRQGLQDNLQTLAGLNLQLL